MWPDGVANALHDPISSRAVKSVRKLLKINYFVLHRAPQSFDEHVFDAVTLPSVEIRIPASFTQFRNAFTAKRLP